MHRYELPALLGLALAVRLLLLVVWTPPIVADSADYDRLARSLAEGRGYTNTRGEPTSWGPPLHSPLGGRQPRERDPLHDALDGGSGSRGGVVAGAARGPQARGRRAGGRGRGDGGGGDALPRGLAPVPAVSPRRGGGAV